MMNSLLMLAHFFFGIVQSAAREFRYGNRWRISDGDKCRWFWRTSA